MAHQFSTSYLEDTLSLFRMYKRLADRAIEQCTDEQLYQAIDPESNSIAIIVKHMAGNLRSRFRDFLTTDGEKPDRNRDSEFDAPPTARVELLALWESGWATLFAAVEPLTDADLSRTVTIRSEPHSVMQAINRQLGHHSMHVGQIVFLAKHLASDKWKPLTIPRNQSQAFNERVLKGEASQR